MKIHLLFHPYWSIWPNDQLDKLNILISQLEVNLCCNRSRIKSNIQVPTTQVAIGVHQLGTTYMLPHHLVATVPVFKIYHLPGYKQCPGRTQTMDSCLHNWKFFLSLKITVFNFLVFVVQYFTTTTESLPENVTQLRALQPPIDYDSLLLVTFWNFLAQIFFVTPIFSITFLLP